MKEMIHLICVIILIIAMTFWFLQENVCGVCLAGFLLINARLNERKEE